MKNKDTQEKPQAAQSALQTRLAALDAEAAAQAAAQTEAEALNPLMAKLLRAGIDFRTAYDFVHRDDQLREIVAQVADSVRVRVLRDIETRGARPLENGTTGRAPATLREPLPSEWTREERERIGREALRGKKHTVTI